MADGAVPVAPRRVHIETWGCTTNLGDTRTMQGLLTAAGHRLVGSSAAADVVVLNTCTVVDTTDQHVLHRLRGLRADGKEVVLAGCMAAAQPQRLLEEAPGAPLVTPRTLHQIADVVAGQEPHARPPARRPPKAHVGVEAVVPIAQGCVFSCAYCLTKVARGDQDSDDLEGLVADVRDAVNAGAIDIRLTAQDTSGYGFDGGPRLPELLGRLVRIGGDFRIRVGMMHPRTAHRILDPLLDAMDHPKVYKFLHVPIQTGSPRLLDAMRRGNTLDEFWTVVTAFRARFPRSVVSTDLIVGFPGETEEDHRMTLDLVRRLEAEHVNVTRFSARPGTPAKSLPGRVPTDVAKRRSRETVETALAHMAGRYVARIGDTIDLFVLEEGTRAGSMRCRGPAHEPVVVRRPASALPIGSRVRARVVAARPTYLIAEPVAPPMPVRKGAGPLPVPP